MADLLPPEIALDIFYRLPVESILQSRQVCKTWRRLLRDTHFVSTHLRHQLQQQQIQQHRLDHDDDDDLYHKVTGSGISNNGVGGGGGKVSFIFLGGQDTVIDGRVCGSLQYAEYEYNEGLHHKTLKKKKINCLPLVDRPSYGIIGSCNGLICFSVIHTNPIINDTVHILNPVTGEQLNLPNFINDNTTTTTSCNDGSYRCVRMAFGFGYLPSTNEYKVVRISYPIPSGDVGKVELYTIGAGSGWRNKGEISANLLCPAGMRIQFRGVYADGALHWLDYKNSKVVTFNLADEEFFMLPPPRHFQSSERAPCVVVLGGSLCFIYQNQGKSMDVWSLKNKNKKNKNISDGTKEQDCEWRRSSEFSIKYEVRVCDCLRCNYKPFAITKSGEVLLLHNIRTTLCLYDTKTSTLKEFKDSDLGHNVFQAIPHVNSFVSLKALGEKLVIPE